MKRAAAWGGLIFLTGLNLLNYIDRQIPAAIEVPLKRDLIHRDEQIGLLATAFVIVYMVASPVFGMLGDRWSRTRLIAFGVMVWSVATASSGLARGFGSLFTSRMVVGIGEAAYGTIAPALLADYFPRPMRGPIFAIFYAAIPIGSALGYYLGGVIMSTWGWRWAFVFTGLPGVAFALGALWLFDPERGQHDDADVAGHGRFKLVEAWQLLARNRLYLMTVAGYAAGTFAIVGLAFWMPAFLTRVRGMDMAEGPKLFGMVVAAAGLVGTLSGGWLGERAQRYSKFGYLWVSGVTTLAAVPCTVLALTLPGRSQFVVATFAAAALVFCSTGPVNTLIVNVVSPAMRATAVAASTVAIHLFGDAISPWLIGSVSDRAGLQTAVMIVPVVMTISGLIWTITAWRSKA